MKNQPSAAATSGRLVRRPKLRTAVSVVALAFGLAACAGNPTAPDGDQSSKAKAALLLQVADETDADGDPATAASLYQQLHALEPKDPVPLERLASASIRIGDYRGAALAYRAAIAADPKNADLSRGLALALLLAGDTDGALGEIRRAMATDGSDPRLYILLGVAQDLSGRSDLAQQTYRHGMQIAPTNLGLRNNYALSLALGGDYADAVKELSGIAGPQAAPRYRLNLALAYGLAGDDTKAAEVAREVLDERSVESNLADYTLLRGMTASQRTAAILGSELHGSALALATAKPTASFAAPPVAQNAPTPLSPVPGAGAPLPGAPAPAAPSAPADAAATIPVLPVSGGSSVASATRAVPPAAAPPQPVRPAAAGSEAPATAVQSAGAPQALLATQSASASPPAPASSANPAPPVVAAPHMVPVAPQSAASFGPEHAAIATPSTDAAAASPPRLIPEDAEALAAAMSALPPGPSFASAATTLPDLPHSPSAASAVQLAALPILQAPHAAAVPKVAQSAPAPATPAPLASLALSVSPSVDQAGANAAAADGGSDQVAEALAQVVAPDSGAAAAIAPSQASTAQAAQAIATSPQSHRTPNAPSPTLASGAAGMADASAQRAALSILPPPHAAAPTRIASLAPVVAPDAVTLATAAPAQALTAQASQAFSAPAESDSAADAQSSALATAAAGMVDAPAVQFAALPILPAPRAAPVPTVAQSAPASSAPARVASFAPSVSPAVDQAGASAPAPDGGSAQVSAIPAPVVASDSLAVAAAAPPPASTAEASQTIATPPESNRTPDVSSSFVATAAAGMTDAPAAALLAKGGATDDRAQASTAPAKPGLQFTVQFGSFHLEATAHHLADGLTAQGLPVTVLESVGHDGQVWFAVRTEDFATRDAAQQVLREAQASGCADAIVVPLRASGA